MTSATGPVLPRRRLASALRELRTNAGLTLERAAEELMISRSKLSRLEKGQGSPQGRDVRDLIKLYGQENTELAEKLMRWVREARRQGWWHDYSYDSSGTMADVDTHIAYEFEAAIARVYTIPFIPALLQTVEYTRELYRSLEPWRDAEEIDQLVLLRGRRQEQLTRREDQPPLRLIAVIHESCLRQLVGSREIMHRQLAGLDRWFGPDSPVELRVLPFDVTPAFASSCMFALFEFAEPMDRDAVHIETHAGFRYIEIDSQILAYRRHFDTLQRKALTVPATREFLRATARSWE